MEEGFEISGFVPKNRLAEDGRISDKYKNLIETKTEDFAERTLLNVTNSDATLILSHGNLNGGSLLTEKFARQQNKPCLHIDFLQTGFDQAVNSVKKWLDSINCEILNIAGSRASEDANIYAETKLFLKKLFE